MKKTILIVIMLLSLFSPIVSAASLSGEYYPPPESDYFQKKVSQKVYITAGIAKLKMTQRDYDTNEVVGVITWNVKPGENIWIDEFCKGPLAFEFIDEEGNSTADSFIRGKTDHYLNEGSCGSGSFVSPSDYNEEEGRYASDTFGGAENELSNPPTNDGSGGSGSTGFEGIDDGTSSGGDDETGGDSGSGGSCSACGIFESPHWDDYMGKLEEIKNSIPPAPNWDEVAGKFRDTIVPSLVDDLEDMLGTAPAPLPAPAVPSGVDDGGISEQQPNMEPVPELEDSGFNQDDIEAEAPEIEFREDPTGGFDLSDNPVDALPDMPTDAFPIPGETDAGVWDDNKPETGPISFPEPPASGGGGTGEAPVPGDSTGEPPTPGGSGGTAPTPGGGTTGPPTPGGGTSSPGTGCYKAHPSDPDGSGC